MRAEAVQLIIRDLRTFLAITSIANSQPASGLAKSTATPAVTPAHISSRLYILAENSLL